VIDGLNSASAMATYGQRLLVFTEDRLMTFAPLAGRERTTMRRVFAGTTESSSHSIGIAVEEDSAHPADDTIWLARGRVIRRFSPATSEESPGLRIPGEVLDLDRSTGGLLALVAFDADGATRLVRLSAEVVEGTVH
jgi:hypothetical protein